MKIGDAVIINEDPHRYAADGTIGHVTSESRIVFGVDMRDIDYFDRSGEVVTRPLTMRNLALATPDALASRADALEAEAAKLRKLPEELA